MIIKRIKPLNLFTYDITGITDEELMIIINALKSFTTPEAGKIYTFLASARINYGD